MNAPYVDENGNVDSMKFAKFIQHTCKNPVECEWSPCHKNSFTMADKHDVVEYMHTVGKVTDNPGEEIRWEIEIVEPSLELWMEKYAYWRPVKDCLPGINEPEKL